MSSENKYIKYTAGDIEKYLAGKLSQLEMHAMEKAALDDPLLYEAMEGYEGMKDTEWNNQLVSLREAIANKGVVAKVIPLHKTKNRWWKTAAAIFILGFATALTIYLANDNPEEKNNPQIAQTPTITFAADSLLQPENPAPATGTVSLNPTASATTEDIKTTTDLLTQAQTEKKPDDKYIPDPNAPQVKAVENDAAAGAANNEKIIANAPPIVTNPPPAANNNGQSDEVNNAAKNKAAPKSLYENETLSRQKNNSNASFKKEAPLNNFFTAQVVAADNTPLPFTNISIKKDNFGTYADAKGMVRLVSTDSILNIEVRSVGYTAKTFTLRNNQVQPQIKIVLQEDEMARKDTRVIGDVNLSTNRSSRRATLVTDSVVNVEPADGWENYNTYVANNLDISEEMLKRDIRGEVELSFDVKSNGTISNIRINKSLGAEYDEAAKRLILEGPQWKVKKGRKTSAKVKVQF